jgi:hypothetical protein
VGTSASILGSAKAALLLFPIDDTGTVGGQKDLSNVGPIGDVEGVGLITIVTGVATNLGQMNVLFEHALAPAGPWVTCAHVNTGGANGDGYSDTTNGSFQVLTYPIDLSKTHRYIRATSALIAGDSVVLGCLLHAFKKASG